MSLTHVEAARSRAASTASSAPSGEVVIRAEDSADTEGNVLATGADGRGWGGASSEGRSQSAGANEAADAETGGVVETGGAAAPGGGPAPGLCPSRDDRVSAEPAVTP